MNLTLRDQWLESLRSGEYPQAFNELVNEANGTTCYCATGLLGMLDGCEVKPNALGSLNMVSPSSGLCGAHPPVETMIKAGIASEEHLHPSKVLVADVMQLAERMKWELDETQRHQLSERYKDIELNIVSLNDTLRLSFEQIADCIEFLEWTWVWAHDTD